MNALSGFDWRGNIRELQNEVERASLFCGDGERIDVDHLSEKIMGGGSTAAAEELQVSRWGLVQKIKALGIEG